MQKQTKTNKSNFFSNGKFTTVGEVLRHTGDFQSVLKVLALWERTLTCDRQNCRVEGRVQLL